MTGPRTKRQFAGAASDPAQRQITSFFSKASPGAVTDTAHAQSQQAALSGPHLPAQIQTDLLNVGMRVRKAIPEGYKTGSNYSAFTLWDDHNTSTSKSDHNVATTTTMTSSAYSSTMRELEPFCGLNKVGGLAFQPAHHRFDEGYHTDNDAMPGLTSSQDTVSSTASSSSNTFPPTPSSSQPQPQPPHIRLSLVTTTTTPGALPITTLPTRKRVLTTDEEEATQQHLQPHQLYSGPIRLRSDGWLDSEWEGISPRSVAPPAGLWENARVLAVPRRSKLQLQQGQHQGQLGQQGYKMAAAAAAAVAVGEGQERVVVEEQEQENVMVVVQGDDFEEASFLDYGGLGGEGRMEIE